MPGRPERDRGRASPGQSLGGGALLAGGHRVFDRAARRQISSTARACEPAARSSAGAPRADILVLVV